MSEYNGFSISTVKRANMMMMMGIKPDCYISDKLSREDIERAWKEAAVKIFGSEHRND